MPFSSESTPGLRLEHVVIRVDDLAVASRDYQSLGFQVVYGGVHGSGFTHNALIYFQDGTFFELVAFRKVLTAKILLASGLLDLFLKHTNNHIKYRFIQAVRFPEGFMDAALFSSDIVIDTERANRGGLKTTKPVAFERKKPNNEILRWNITSPFADALPFVRDAYVPEQHVGRDETRHDNGALGISLLVYAVKDLPATVADYQRLSGKDISISTEGGKHYAEFTLGGVAIRLLPVDAFPELETLIANKRETPVEVGLRTGGNASLGELPLAKTHQARIILQQV